MDASIVCTDAQSIADNAKTAENETESISTRQNSSKSPNSPVEAARQRPDSPNNVGDHMVRLRGHRDMHSIGNDPQMAVNKTENVRMHQIRQRTQNSPNLFKMEMSKHASRQKWISIGDGDLYIPWNMPVEVLETMSRVIVFRQVESRDEAIAPSVKGKKVGDGDGRQSGDDGDVDGTTSISDIDSERVGAALLAVGSQHLHQSQRTGDNDLPVSSGPPIQHADHPYGLVRQQQ